MPASFTTASMLPHPPHKGKQLQQQNRWQYNETLNPIPIPEPYHEYFTEAQGRKNNKMTFPTILRDI